MSVIRRSNSVIQNDTGTNAAFAASYTVIALPVGAVAVSFAGNTATVDAGHGFAAGDKVLVWDGTTATFVAEALSSVTATTLVWASATPTIAATDRLCNLGPDTATGTTPAYDASPMVIYSDADAATAISNSLVTTDSTGNYGYWTRGDGRNWELIRTSAGVAASVVQGWGGLSGRFNIADFGASVDGSTSDHLRVDSAMLAASALGGGEVFLPEGDTELTSELTCRSNVNLVGVGKSSKISTTQSDFDILNILTLTDIRVSGIFFEGASQDQTDAGTTGGRAVVINTSSVRIKFDNCHFEKFDDVIHAGDSSHISVTNCTAKENAGALCRWLGVVDSDCSDNQFDGTRTVGDAQNSVNFMWTGGSAVADSSRITVANNQIQNCSFEALNLGALNHSSATGNIIESNGSGGVAIDITSNPTESSQPTTTGIGNTISANVIRNSGTGGIRIGHGNSNSVSAHDNIVTGNVIDVCGGIGIEMKTDSFNNLIIGNHITSTASHGIVTGATSKQNQIIGNRVINSGTTTGTKRGIMLQGGAGDVISGNWVYKGDSQGIAISGTCTDVSVIGNIVIDAGSTSATAGIDGIIDEGTTTRTFISGNKCWSEDSTHQRYGISVGANAVSPFVIGNDCRNNVNTTDGIFVSASATTPVVHSNLQGNTALVTVAAAATTTLPNDGDFINITGATGITSITASWIGRRVTLSFASNPVITDGSNLKLAGNYSTVATDTLTLVSDGTNWHEVSRSVVSS